MVIFRDFLTSHLVSEDLSKLLFSLISSIKEISSLLRSAKGLGGKAGSLNTSGDEQIALDIQSNSIIEKHLKESSVVGLYASEELEKEVLLEGNGALAVAFDPLDGSSLVDANMAVGSIFGIYRTDNLIGIRGDQQIAAMAAVYGPNTTLFITLCNGVHQFSLIGDEFVLTCEDMKVEEEKKYFAPGNLQAVSTERKYLELMNYWMLEGYKLRYSGGMVPDVGHILVKGGGIFCYPGYVRAPQGKLRLLYEACPMAFLMEEAGGAAYSGMGKRILEIPVDILAQRTPVFIGSKKDVEMALSMLV